VPGGWAGAALARELASVAEAEPGREVCGFVVVDRWGTPGLAPMRNVVGAPEEAGGTPGDPRLAYRIDPVGHLALARRLRVQGGRIVAVYHSHVDGPALPSRADLAEALMDGLPVLPGVDQVLIATAGGKVTDIRVFRWSGGVLADAGPLPGPWRVASGDPHA
jgi:[CysO sulfur-carrier protein]-S-L-cysteine hydrolase